MRLVRYLIFFINLTYLTLFLSGCGRNFKTVDVNTAATPEAPAKPTEISDTKNSDKSEEKKQVVDAVSEAWMQDIPNKYDDVGDFFRIKEVPGLSKDQVLDSRPMGSEGSAKAFKLIRGKLKLSNITRRFDSVRNVLEIAGEVVFDDGRPMSFALSGPYKPEGDTNIIDLNLNDEQSPLKNLFRAKAVCSGPASVDQGTAGVDGLDFCKKLTIDFYYRHQDTFYTDQLISKSILYDEIKRTEAPPATVVPDSIFENIPDENLSDYERSQKKGIRDGVADVTSLEELPYYFIEPTIDDVATLYPEVSRDVEEQKKIIKKNKKKSKLVPKLNGEEKIPEKDPALPPPPALNEDIKTNPPKVPTPTPGPTPPVVPPKVPTPTPGPTPPAVPPKVPTPTPGPTAPAVPPKVPTVVPPKTPAPVTDDGTRPIDQAWGMPDTGKYIAATKKVLYLTRSNSILEASQKLGPTAGFEVLYPTKKRHYGTYDMIEMFADLGEWLMQNYKGFGLYIGDSSAINGGPIGTHASHKTGMDVDIAYLTRNPKMIFNRMDIPNKGGYTHSDFAAAEQWQLMKAAHEVSSIEVIYVNRNIKNEMCKQALKAGDLTSKTDFKSPAARILTKMIVEDDSHGNHWHVRLDCAALKGLGVQRQCVVHPQAFIGPECKNIKL